MDRWIEVDLAKLTHNFRLIRQYVAPEIKILAVVKADGYGHGLVGVGKHFASLGADYLGVTEIAEGVMLREADISVPILIFAPFLAEDLSRLAQYDLTATISSLAMLKSLGEADLPFKCHLKLETGLGRTGFSLNDLSEGIIQLGNYPQITVEGVYTHLATAMWKNNQYVKEQMAVFEQGVQLLETSGYKNLLKHAANSAALIKYPNYHLDMVRVGTILYGQEGGAYQRQLGGALQDSWCLKSRITAIEYLPKGHGVGYERAFITKRPTKIAIVPVGYSHGLGIEPIMRTRKLKDLLKVLAKTLLRYANHNRMQLYGQINHQRAPIVGKIGMQLAMIDITDVAEATVGDTVILPARRTLIDPTIVKIYLDEEKINHNAQKI